MDKRYQIFISSTFSDLIEERQAVLKAILEIDHTPAGMELFPAIDDSAWLLIQDVIDASDYYALIVGGRYGSLDSQGISYTEKEYDYARKQKKPVIALLHKNPDNLPRGKTEADPNSWEKLKSFRKKVEAAHTCVYWETADELKARMIVGLSSSIKRFPAVGWVRADQVPSGASLKEAITLRDRIAELEKELETTRTTPPIGSESLMQDNDTFDIVVRFTAEPPHGGYYDRAKYDLKIKPTWNEIFAAVAPVMINEAKDSNLRDSFRSFFVRFAHQDAEQTPKLKKHKLMDFVVLGNDIDTCIVQLRALGLIEENQRKRSVTDKGTYWSLTPYGDLKMVQLRALRRDHKDQPREAAIAQEAKEE